MAGQAEAEFPLRIYFFGTVLSKIWPNAGKNKAESGPIKARKQPNSGDGVSLPLSLLYVPFINTLALTRMAYV
jgi:hypothetical protein